MKIVHVTATFPPNYTGAGKVCYHNCLELAKLGHDVTVFTAEYLTKKYSDPKILKVKRLKPVFRIGNAPFIPGLLKMDDYDIVHLHYPFIFGSEMIYLRSKLLGHFYVLTYHQDLIGTGLRGYAFKLNNAILLKNIVRNAKKVFPTSLDYARNSKIKDVINERLSDVVEIPNGVDTRRFNPQVNGDLIKEKYKIKGKVVLFVGALDRAHFFKGLDKLIAAFSELNNKEYYLLIVGDGDMKKMYMKKVKDCGISDKTIFAGFVSEEELPKYYAAADVLVLPSITMGEAFGIVLLEAMASGKAVITSNLPGIRTVVNDGYDGILVRPGDTRKLKEKISYLLQNPELMIKMGIRGRKKVEKQYSWSKIGVMLESVYRDLIY